MSAKTATPAKQQQSGFNKWYNSPAGQRTVGIVYSLGAAVVIIGALFKIQHWPGASVILTLGMCTEAFLFTIGVFEKPHADYKWNKIFPALLSDEESVGIDVSKGGVLGGMANAMSTVDTNVEGKLEESDAKKLSESIKALSETASGLRSISDAVAATGDYTRNIQNASNSLAGIAEQQATLKNVSSTLAEAYRTISASANETVNLDRNLKAINSVYEMQLKGAQAQADAFKAQIDQVNAVTDSMQRMQSSVNGIAADFNTYKQATEQLVQKVTDLNSVYGNMLNAMRH